VSRSHRRFLIPFLCTSFFFWPFRLLGLRSFFTFSASQGSCRAPRRAHVAVGCSNAANMNIDFRGSLLFPFPDNLHSFFFFFAGPSFLSLLQIFPGRPASAVGEPPPFGIPPPFKFARSGPQAPVLRCGPLLPRSLCFCGIFDPDQR